MKEESMPEPTKNSWAFAVDLSKRVSKAHARSRRHLRDQRTFLNRCVITACSREARSFGIKIGMRYAEAKHLIPDMRILIYNR